jgi:Flp pilus assembly protein TadG
MTRRGLIARLRREESGTIAVLVAASMVVLLGFLAFAVDVGNAYLHKRRLQSAVDLALVTAAQKLPDTTKASADVNSYIDTNWHKRDTSTPTKNVTTGCQVPNNCPQPNKVSVTASVDVPTYFAKLFGVNKWTVRAHGAACGPCDTTQTKFDVMVVLDRSYSMCLDSNGNPYSGSYTTNRCDDINNAVAGIKSLLGFFNPNTDRVGLTVLSSGDDHSPNNFHTGSSAPRCDGSAGYTDLYAGKGSFYNTLGDFMDGTAADHDTWVVAPLNSDFKKSDGSINNSSQLVSTLNCLQPKFWTPIAPAVKEATDALITNGRSDARKLIVFMGDGGANVQPMKRNANGSMVDSTGAATTDPTKYQASWYTPTSGNNLLPCHDAVGQAARAKANNIEIYTIGYDLTANGASQCYKNNKPSTSGSEEGGIDAESTLRQMATNDAHFYKKASAGEVYTIFNAIGHQITGSGIRLIE